MKYFKYAVFFWMIVSSIVFGFINHNIEQSFAVVISYTSIFIFFIISDHYVFTRFECTEAVTNGPTPAMIPLVISLLLLFFGGSVYQLSLSLLSILYLQIKTRDYLKREYFL